ncbi:Wzz/FepE/Etk N-terminal domain-containing protein [Actinomadura macrotermitis]|uniref:Polysaccharide chain length determinant N-terminal domain-containing protein n=1 Tax=Actinomadura macrotermitis TaxID=2585200 RepID=A0A7K0BR69_9ACTN|nr:Wzz/FepE/Etk N-terminal domain-containing protein [Actinomadura macrotermitis]MQY03683.1 hypothetical protein [Actinomadura macrotermitis]
MSKLQEPAKNLLGRFGPAAALLLLGALCGLVYALVRPPVYAATAHIIVVGKQDQNPAVNFAQVYGRLAVLPETLAYDTGTYDPKLADNVKATTSPDAPLIRLTGSGETPARAVQRANAAAQALIRFGAEREEDTGVRLALMNQAVPPLRPAAPNGPLDVAVGAAAGLLLAVLAAAAGLRPALPRTRREEKTARHRSPVPAPSPAPAPAPAPAPVQAPAAAPGEGE